MSTALCRLLGALVLPALILLASSGAAGAEANPAFLKLVRGSSTSLKQAISTAEKDLKGTAYAAGAKADGDHLVFTVKLIVNNKAVSARIDGRTGRLSNPGPIANESQALLKDFAKAKKTLISAVRTAEASAKSKAFQARFKRQGNNALYEIDTAARDDVEKEIVIDAFSGKVRKVTEISSTSQADTGAQADVPAVAQ